MGIKLNLIKRYILYFVLLALSALLWHIILWHINKNYSWFVKKWTKSCPIQSISISLNMLYAQMVSLKSFQLSWKEAQKPKSSSFSKLLFKLKSQEFKDEIDLILLVFYFSKCSSRVINHRIWNCMAHACQFVTIVSNWSFCSPWTTLAKIAHNLLVHPKLGNQFWKWTINCK